MERKLGALHGDGGHHSCEGEGDVLVELRKGERWYLMLCCRR